MADRRSHVSKVDVDVGTPPTGFRKWDWEEFAVVYFHGFADLSTVRGDEILSQEFTCLGRKWRLCILPGGALFSDEEDMVALDLRNMSDEGINVKFLFSVRDKHGKEMAHFEAEYKYSAYDASRDVWGEADFASRSELIEDALVGGTLTVEVRMKRVGPTTEAFLPENPIRKHILKKFMDEESADVVFHVGGGSWGGSARKRAKTSTVTFHAHRLILADGAPELAEMCGSNSGGDATPVSIPDMNPGVFKHMLYYVYGGKVTDQDMKEITKDLIDAADKFSVVNLKLEAEACYVKSARLTTDNIIDNLLYAESKNCALLKEAVMDYIVQNGDDVMDKVSFEDVPGTVAKDLWAAMARGKKKDEDDGGNLKTMSVGTLRRKLHEKGLDVDGSREAMIMLLNENA